jgi:hypothetical protein
MKSNAPKFPEVPNTPSNRADHLRRYAFAGAGAAVIAGAVTTADAGVVFVTTYDGQVYQDSTPNAFGSELWDFKIDPDNFPDFRLRNEIGASYITAAIRSPVGGTLDVIGQQGVAGPYTLNYPSRLSAGAVIGPAATFFTLNDANNNGTMASGYGFAGEKWFSTSGATGFLGIRFTFNGETHYGFVNLTVAGSNDPAPFHFTINSIAYEDQANTAITAVPEPGTLGLLALGAVGLAAYRRKMAKKAE